MPKSTLTWYKTKSKRIVNELKLIKQKELASAINESQQTVSYRINHLYQEQLEDWLRLLDILGYEVKEKEDVEV